MFNKLTGVIIGHSFVTRLDNALIMECPAGCIVPQQQLTPVQLEVDDIYKHIYIEGRSGAKIGSLIQAVDLTGSLRRSNVVMFMVGSNDLCDAGADPMQVATDLLSLMDYMQTAYDVPLVVCCGAVPRDRCRDITAEEFRTQACTFNKCLHQGCPPGSGRKYVNFKGFWSDGPQGNPLPGQSGVRTASIQDPMLHHMVSTSSAPTSWNSCCPLPRNTTWFGTATTSREATGTTDSDVGSWGATKTQKSGWVVHQFNENNSVLMHSSLRYRLTIAGDYSLLSWAIIRDLHGTGQHRSSRSADQDSGMRWPHYSLAHTSGHLVGAAAGAP